MVKKLPGAWGNVNVSDLYVELSDAAGVYMLSVYHL